MATMRRITKEFHTRASGAHPLELLEVQEVEGLVGEQAVEEVPDGSHINSDSFTHSFIHSFIHSSLTFQLPDDALVHENQEGIMLLVVPVAVQRHPQVGKELL